MKRILIVYIPMVIGGSTTSLLSILNNLDYSKYSVDLLLRENKGELFDKIPKEINLLEPAIKNLKLVKLKRMFSPTSLYLFIKSRILAYKYKNKIVSYQVTGYDIAKFSRKLQQEYDVAISFLEVWPTYYVADFVNAKKKIAWVHVDYKAVGFLPSIDVSRFKKFDKIVLVSERCTKRFIECFPKFRDNTITIENILSSNFVKLLAEETVSNFKMDPSKLNMSTVCRIDFTSKGLDRGVKIFHKLTIENLCNDVVWYIIGDGPDYIRLFNLIKQYNLENQIVLLGKKENPYKYIKDSDLFFLPSRYEGKPMAVTEAMILGIPPVVAEYTSAKEQIRNNVDGLIFDNTDHAIYEGLKMIFQERDHIELLKKNLVGKDYTNISEMKKIYSLFDE